MPDTTSTLSRALDRLGALQAELDALRPLTDEQLGRAMQRLRLEWTYHSNAIEGNSLTYGETRALLMHGVTAQGKPLKDHLDIRRHGETINYVETLIRSEEPVRVDLVKEIHHRLMGEEYEITAETPDGEPVKRTVQGGVYKEHPNNVRTETGEVHYYVDPLEVPGRMADLVEWLGGDETREMHPVARAALFHHRFVEIHPFPDGNGRVSRMLMNVLLMRDGYVPAVIRQENRPAYYGALAAADGGDPQLVVAFVADELAETMELYLRAVKGTPDPEAFKRRVAILRRRQTTSHPTAITRSKKEKLTTQFVLPLLSESSQRVETLIDLFARWRRETHVSGSNMTKHEGAEAMQAIESGDWYAFRVDWVLENMIAKPSFTQVISYHGVLHPDGFNLSFRSPKHEWYYAGDQFPGVDETGQVIETSFESVLRSIEEASGA